MGRLLDPQTRRNIAHSRKSPTCRRTPRCRSQQHWSPPNPHARAGSQPIAERLDGIGGGGSEGAESWRRRVIFISHSGTPMGLPAFPKSRPACRYHGKTDCFPGEVPSFRHSPPRSCHRRSSRRKDQPQPCPQARHRSPGFPSITLPHPRCRCPPVGRYSGRPTCCRPASICLRAPLSSCRPRQRPKVRLTSARAWKSSRPHPGRSTKTYRPCSCSHHGSLQGQHLL